MSTNNKFKKTKQIPKIILALSLIKKSTFPERLIPHNIEVRNMMKSPENIINIAAVIARIPYDSLNYSE